MSRFAEQFSQPTPHNTTKSTWIKPEITSMKTSLTQGNNKRTLGAETTDNGNDTYDTFRGPS